MRRKLSEMKRFWRSSESSSTGSTASFMIAHAKLDMRLQPYDAQGGWSVECRGADPLVRPEPPGPGWADEGVGRGPGGPPHSPWNRPVLSASPALWRAILIVV